MAKRYKEEDYVGKKYNMLTVIKRLDKKLYPCGIKRDQWLFKCDCGKERINELRMVITGDIKSCGCLLFQGRVDSKYDPHEASYRAKASNYKANAKQRKIDWDLNIERVVELLKSNCYYCGIEPSNVYNIISRNRKYSKRGKIHCLAKEDKYEIKYNGIDRMDNKIGYKEGNVVPCCTQCNSAKMCSTLEDFYKWIERIKNFKRKDQI